ncbi:MAG: adenosylmethionine--8-amino-7-oxononanoate transaminase [Candidatus Obscuribacterales bacterium]|nr:adenosylmethionine--8-amino-7-oxononanoate transaminase [Candidatus Obscuribacterales bacterium]
MQMTKSAIWHPFTQMLTAEPPLKVARGEGSYLILEDDKRLLDCISSWWVNIHGHAHPEIAEAIFEQAKRLEQVIFAGFTHQPAEDVAAALLERLPKPLAHVFYSDNGSTSVEVALKMAYQYWMNLGQEKHRFIAFDGGYHGDTIGAMSIGRGSPFWSKFDRLLFEIDIVPFPETFENDQQVEAKEKASLSALREIIEKNKNQHVAICIEPLIQGAAGMRMCRPEFLQALRQVATENQILLIFDEVMTGFGRTGDFFASKKSQATPDIICLSKGITGGFLPLSVTVCSSSIYETFLSESSDKTFFHGHSYTANPLACAAAVCSWKLLNKNQHLFQTMENTHRKLVQEELQGHPLIRNVRFCGTIFAAEINTKESDSYFNSLAVHLKKRFIDRGFLIRPLGNTIYLMPPYCTTEDSLRSAYRAIRSELEDLATLA